MTDRCAVVDIGSNSVRLVIYEGPSRAPTAICNEKSLCGLGRDMTTEGALNPDSMALALATLRRFKRILREHGDPPARAVATAAVREARNGADFVREIERTGFAVEVIPGAEEARLAALGVVSFEPGATGLVGDLGGGSLELTGLAAGEIGERVSLSIGPLRLMQASRGDLKRVASIIETELASIRWIGPGRHDVIYAVGGAWRALARIEMQHRNYPLPVLHHYEMPARPLMEVCDFVAKLSRQSLEDIPGLANRRLDTLPYAAMALKSLIQRTSAKSVVISTGGVREGVLYDRLTPEERAEDPLMVGVRFLAGRLSPSPDYGEGLVSLTAGLFPGETPAERRVRVASCLLSDVGAFFHPDMRGLHAADTAIRAPLVSISHAEKVSMALALYCRHEGAKEIRFDPDIVALLDEGSRLRATRLGLALRFAGAFSPKAAAPFKGCRLAYAGGKIVFTAPEDRRILMEDLPKRRLEAVAASFDAPLVVEFWD